MEKFIIDKYSFKHLKNFSQYVISNELSNDLKKIISIKFSLIPLSSNGYVIAKKCNDGYRYNIRINLLPFLIGKFSSNRMRLFYLYVTIIHELNHVYLLECKNPNTYSELLAFCEEYRGFSYLRLMDSIEMLLMNKNASKTRKNKYKSSLAEIICNLKAFEKVYRYFESYLNQSEIDKINRIIESLNFLQNHITITYGHGNQPYNIFTKMVIEFQPLLKNNLHELNNRLKPLIYLFSSDGHMKSIEQLFQERTDENKNVIDELLINWFICADINFSPIFENNVNLKKHLELLSNHYCDKSINYLKNIEIGEIFLDKDILQDNASMIIKNVDRLNKLMSLYNMVHINGSIIPYYYTAR